MDQDRPVSGYGSRLERFTESATEELRQSRGNAGVVESAIRSLLSGITLAFKTEHLIHAFRHALVAAGYSEAETSRILKRVEQLVAPGTYSVAIIWPGGKPSVEEIASIRLLRPDLAIIPASKCKMELESSGEFLFGTYKNLLEAENDRERAAANGLVATVVEQG